MGNGTKSKGLDGSSLLSENHRVSEIKRPACQQTGCVASVTHRYFWPGQAEGAFACEPHAIAAIRVANACGFILPIESLEPEACPETEREL